MRCLWLAMAALAIQAQTPPDPTDVLARARDNLIQRDRRLPNYTCVQTVDRKYLVRALADVRPPPCDQIMAENHKNAYALNVFATDRLRLDVKVSSGVEIGSWAGANQFDSRSITDLAGGPFGTGPFGPLLNDVFLNPQTAFSYVETNPPDDGRLFHYRFQVPQEASHLMVRGGGDWVATAYDGELWIDPDSFDLKRIAYRTSQLSDATNACETRLTADYAKVHFDSGDFLIPQQSTMHAIMIDTQETETISKYSRCREYRGESTLSFGDAPVSSAASSNSTAQKLQPLPGGLKIAMALTAPIDTDTAAAGDVVQFEVSKAVRDASKQVVIPARSIVHGRIVKLQHWPAAFNYSMAILLEKLEIAGVPSPIYARLDQPNESKPAAGGSSGLRSPGVPISLPPAGQSMSVGTFTFRRVGDHYVIPRNFMSNWITLPAPSAAAQ